MAALALLPTQAMPQVRTTPGNPLDQLPLPDQLPTSPGSIDAKVLAAPLPQTPAPGRTVVPLRFDIEGVQAISFDAVAALFQPLLGKSTSVAALSELARQVTTRYQQSGYALSFAFVPEQNFENGVVRIVAVEGHIQTIKIEGDAGAAEPQMRAIAEHIRQERPLKLATFERYTQLMAQLPGLRVEARATPPERTDGNGTLVLTVRRQAFQLSLSTELRTARPRVVVTGAANDLLASGSRLSVSTLLGAYKDEAFAAAAYTTPIGSDGLTLKAEVSLYRGNPDAQFDVPVSIERLTHNQRVELSVNYPLKLTASQTMVLSGGVYGVNDKQDYFVPANGVRLSDEVRSRAVYAQASYTTARADQTRSLVGRLTQGINALGASAALTANVAATLPASNTRLDFTRFSLEGSQRDSWGKNWGTAVSFALQHSPHVLPSSERVSFGSSRFGRAYIAGEVAGDSGWGLALEGNRSFALGTGAFKQLQPYVLLEAAHVRSTLGTLAFSKLASTSLGFRLSGGNSYVLDLALSKPTGDASPENPERKLRASLQLSYSFDRK